MKTPIFKSQAGEATKGLTRQHFDAIAFVIAEAVDHYEKRRKDDDPATSTIALNFVDLSLVPVFQRYLAICNPKGFSPEGFRDTVDSEMKLVLDGWFKGLGMTDDELEKLDDSVQELAEGLCTAVETVSGKTIDDSITDGTLAYDVATATKAVKDEGGDGESTAPEEPPPYELDNEHRGFLNRLRESGAVNMFGAAPHLQDAFGLSKQEAREALTAWMNSFKE